MSAFAERVLANVREEIRAEVAYALELAGEPELLEALKVLTDNIEHAWPSLMHLGPLVRARAAIASAEGR